MIILKFIIITLLFFLIVRNYFQQKLNDIRYGSNSGVNRIVIDLTADTTFKKKIFPAEVKIIFDKPVFLKSKFSLNKDLSNINFDEKVQLYHLNSRKKLIQ